MIEAEARPPLAALAARLAHKAARIAQARAENAVRARRGDPARWRSARLLWPAFAED
ncbi:hypothetical protein [Pelagerythrobacter rhizovicinus]|uniref:hypothetical protein n=1 Tax=Pelagerythrobacter rhizovicinus TaxID=2268576 RepID=UPI0013EBC222|nr:hypothetical protein [Pelagerythrobacter rhizovicinus]